MDKVIYCVVGFSLGLIVFGVYFEHKAETTGVVQLDSKTYTCKEYKGESK